MLGIGKELIFGIFISIIAIWILGAKGKDWLISTIKKNRTAGKEIVDALKGTDKNTEAKK